MTDKPQMQMTITREWIEDDNPTPPPAPVQKSDGSPGIIIGLVVALAIVFVFLMAALSQPSRGNALPRQDVVPAQPSPWQPSPLIGP